MRYTFTFAFVAVVAAGMAATAWSQAGQAGGAGTAGAAGTPGAAGAANPPTATNQAGATGVSGAPGASGTAGFGTAGNPSGRGNVGFNGQVNGRVNSGADQASFNFDTGINQRPFFSDPGVQRQLNMSPQQFSRLNRAYQEAYGRYVQSLRGLNANLTEEQRLVAMKQFENQFRTDFGRTLDTSFKDPRYRTRYDQLNRQYMGFTSFNDPAIQRQLNLTPQQRLQMQRMAKDWRNQLQKARRNGTQVTQQQWEQMWTQNWDQLNGVFTPEQQQTWSQLTGQRYPFNYTMFSDDVPNQGAAGNVVLPERPAPKPNLPIVPKGGTQPTPGTGSGQTAPQGASANGGPPATTR